MPVYRAKILTPRHVALEAQSHELAAKALQEYVARDKGVLLSLEEVGERIEPPILPPEGEVA